MAVSDGNKVDAATTNASFISRTQDSSTAAKVDLLDADAASGSTITNVQREHNSIASYVGKAVNAVFDLLPTWASDVIGSANDPIKTRVDSVQAVVESNTTNIATNTTNIGDLVTLSGVAVNSTDLGTFLQGIISNNVDVKVALQEIETALSAVTDALDLQGLWNANTNTPTIVDSTGTKGHFYIVSVAGTTTIDGISDWGVGDWILFDGSAWVKVDNTDSVQSVNSQTGVVVLDTDDISEGATNKYVNTQSIDALTDVDTTTVAPTTNQSLVFDGANWVPGAAAGGGSGGINYITNPDFEVDLSDWSIYDDSTAIPVDGTGGAPNTLTAVAITSANRVRGTQSLAFSDNIGGGGLGEGGSTDFTVDLADSDKSARLNISFDYKVPYTYASGNYKVYVYDVTNSVLLTEIINDDNGDILHTGSTSGDDFLPGKFAGSFYTTKDATDYRLLIHSTVAGPKTIVIDNVKVSPDEFIPGYIGTEWQWFDVPVHDNALTNVKSGSPVINDAYWRRVGDSVEVIFRYYHTTTAGASGLGTYTFGVPPGLVVDSSKTFGGAGNSGASLGHARSDLGGGSHTMHTASYSSAGSGGAAFQSHSAITSVGSTFFAFNNTYVAITGRYTLPIVGWSASNLISTTENLFKNVDVRAEGNGNGSITAAVTDIDFTEVSDGLGVWNGSQFTAPESGKYTISGSTNFTASSALAIYAYIDGTINKLIGFNGSSVGAHHFEAELYLTKGQVFSVRSDTSMTLSNNLNNHYISISSVKDTSVFSVYGESELIESLASSGGAWPAAINTWHDFTSITLGPGEWDLSFLINAGTGATSGTYNMFYFIGTVAGNNATGRVINDNGMDTVISGAFQHRLATIPRYNVTITEPTTFYLKGNTQAVPAGNTYNGYKLSARRVK